VAEVKPKRSRGRPRKKDDADRKLTVVIPKHHFDYLEFLALRRHRLGKSAKEVAEHILIRELDAMFRADYHLKEIPVD
jgi:hypothetical protein